jgi:hypothetical protein
MFLRGKLQSVYSSGILSDYGVSRIRRQHFPFSSTILSRVYGYVTNNNVVWIRWLDLLTPSFTISRNHNKWLPRTRSIKTPFWSHYSALNYDWFYSQSQSYFISGGLPPISSSWKQAPWELRPVILLSNWTLAVIGLSDERMGLSFTIAAGSRQRSHSQIRAPRDSWPYFTLSDSRLPQPGGPGPRIYIPQAQAGPVIPPGTGFP